MPALARVVASRPRRSCGRRWRASSCRSGERPSADRCRENCRSGTAPSRSGAAGPADRRSPTGTPSTMTCTVPPPGDRRGGGPDQRPAEIACTVPLTVSPWPGVSMAPNGAVAERVVAHVIVFVPSSVECPSASSAIAWSRERAVALVGQEVRQHQVAPARARPDGRHRRNGARRCPAARPRRTRRGR